MKVHVDYLGVRNATKIIESMSIGTWESVFGAYYKGLTIPTAKYTALIKITRRSAVYLIGWF